MTAINWYDRRDKRDAARALAECAPELLDMVKDFITILTTDPGGSTAAERRLAFDARITSHVSIARALIARAEGFAP